MVIKLSGIYSAGPPLDQQALDFVLAEKQLSRQGPSTEIVLVRNDAGGRQHKG